MQEEIVVHGGNEGAAFEELDAVFTAVSPFLLVLQKRKKNREKSSNESSPANAIADVAPANAIADV